MSEQAVALKTAVKTKGKDSPLAGLLKAGQIDAKDNKEFVKKLLELTKKGEIELDKKGSVKLKNSEIKVEELDATTLMNIKNLLSHVKLNDKLAIEKSVKELRDAVSKSEDKKGTEAKGLKKLLELAKNGGVEVKKVSVEKLDETAETKKTEKTEAKKADKAQNSAEVSKIVEHKISKIEADKVEVKSEMKTEAKGDTKTEVKSDKVAQESNPKQIKEPKRESLPQELKKETPSLVSLLQVSKEKEPPREATAAVVLANETKKEAKGTEQHLKKDVKAVPEAKKENPLRPTDLLVSVFKDMDGAEARAKGELLGLMDLAAKKEIQRDESIAKKEHAAANMFEAPKQSDNELKGKMAVAAEGLKNFSSDIKEMVENYKPPLMKVSMELNPQNLGAVDVTLITRGSNLIVNVSSSQDTMQMFMQNIQEFRQNLMAQGFVSLQMNFNFSEQNKDQNNRQWQKEAAKKYQISSDEMGKIESLDIVMPHPKYA